MVLPAAVPAANVSIVADWDDVRRFALALPETAEREGETPQWRVRDKLFVWERPLRKRDVDDLSALGSPMPDGPILGARVADLNDKAALLEQDAAVYFTVPHFDGYKAVLVRLDRIAVDELQTVVEEAWLAQAPKRLAAQFLASRD